MEGLVLTGMTMPKMNDSDHLSRNNLNSKEEPFMSQREKKQKLPVQCGAAQQPALQRSLMDSLSDLSSFQSVCLLC